MLLQTGSKPGGSTACRLMQLNDVTVTGPDSVELARTLNDLGVLQYLQNNSPLGSQFVKLSFWSLSVYLTNEG